MQALLECIYPESQFGGHASGERRRVMPRLHAATANLSAATRLYPRPRSVVLEFLFQSRSCNFEFILRCVPICRLGNIGIPTCRIGNIAVLRMRLAARKTLTDAKRRRKIGWTYYLSVCTAATRHTLLQSPASLYNLS